MPDQVKRNSKSYRKWLREHLGLDSDHASIPQSGRSITVHVPGTGVNLGPVHGASPAASPGASSGASLDASPGAFPRTLAQFDLTYWFGFPPLDLNAPSLSHLPQPAGRLDPLMDEPSISVFEAKVNELALVRLTPSTRDGEPDFSISDPRVTGTFFHALMENLPESKIVDRDWVRDIAYNQGFHFVHPLRLEAFVDEGMRLLDIYYASPLKELVDEAHRCFNEMPYLMQSNQWVDTRRPDLIIEARGGQWYLIDYKTDKFDPAQIARQVRKHREQLQGYVRDLKLISGIELNAALYFAQFGLLEQIR
jgi:hypothetical protein